MRSAWVFATASLLFPCSARADDGKLDISLEVRARVEAVDGQFRPATAASDTALFLRTLLKADYDAGPFRIGGELLDGRVYFQRRRSSVGITEVNSLEPIQAYIATDFSDRAKLIAGRFTLSLGSRRLISRNNFRNTINAFTGGQAILGDEKRDSAHLFWMVAQSREPDDAESIRHNAVALDRERGSPHVFGAFLSRVRAGFQTDAYVIRLAESDSFDIATRDRHLWTGGGRVFTPPAAGQSDFEVEAAWQWGRTRETAAANDRSDRPVSAGFVHAAAGHTFAVAWQPRIATAFDLATGDGRGFGYHRFDQLYSSRGSDFGPSSLYGALTRTNVLSVEARLETKPDDRTDTYLTVRPLWLANSSDAFATTNVRDVTGQSGSYAGTQIDFRVRRTLSDTLRASVGGTTLFKGRFLDTAPNAPRTGDTHYGFVELTANF